MIGGMGIQELLIIFLVLAVLFGTSRLPKLGRSLGEGIREFRKVGKEIAGDVDE